MNKTHMVLGGIWAVGMLVFCLYWNLVVGESILDLQTEMREELYNPAFLKSARMLADFVVLGLFPPVLTLLLKK